MGEDNININIKKKGQEILVDQQIMKGNSIIAREVDHMGERASKEEVEDLLENIINAINTLLTKVWSARNLHKEAIKNLREAIRLFKKIKRVWGHLFSTKMNQN